MCTQNVILFYTYIVPCPPMHFPVEAEIPTFELGFQFISVTHFATNFKLS